jgi:mannose-6-phosphate isomerase-like protein (cupin superfamily)
MTIRPFKDNSVLAYPESVWSARLAQGIADLQAQICRVSFDGGEPEKRDHVASIGQRVGNHYHPVGDETYKVVQGRGRLHYGQVIDGQVVYEEPVEVTVGDVFVIPEGYSHQLQNIGEMELVILFQCPDNHLDDTNRKFLPDAPTLTPQI